MFVSNDNLRFMSSRTKETSVRRGNYQKNKQTQKTKKHKKNQIKTKQNKTKQNKKKPASLVINKKQK